MIAQPVLIGSELLLPPIYNPEEWNWQKVCDESVLWLESQNMYEYLFLKMLSHQKFKSAVGDDQKSRWYQWGGHFTIISLFQFLVNIIYNNDYEWCLQWYKSGKSAFGCSAKA